MPVVKTFKGGDLYFQAFKTNRMGILRTESGFRKNTVGHHRITAADAYYFDYWVQPQPGWISGKGGKLSGLAGGKASTGGRGPVPDGWSARIMWGDVKGGLRVYLYDQDRKKGAVGRTISMGGNRLQEGKWTRITQYIKVNSPGSRNGILKMWLNGKVVVNRTDIRFRGNVSNNVARVDRVINGMFRGGSTIDWSVARDTILRFSDFQVSTNQPNFGRNDITISGKVGVFVDEDDIPDGPATLFQERGPNPRGRRPPPKAPPARLPGGTAPPPLLPFKGRGGGPVETSGVTDVDLSGAGPGASGGDGSLGGSPEVTISRRSAIVSNELDDESIQENELAIELLEPPEIQILMNEVDVTTIMAANTDRYQMELEGSLANVFPIEGERSIEPTTRQLDAMASAQGYIRFAGPGFENLVDLQSSTEFENLISGSWNVEWSLGRLLTPEDDNKLLGFFSLYTSVTDTNAVLYFTVPVRIFRSLPTIGGPGVAYALQVSSVISSAERHVDEDASTTELTVSIILIRHGGDVSGDTLQMALAGSESTAVVGLRPFIWLESLRPGGGGGTPTGLLSQDILGQDIPIVPIEIGISGIEFTSGISTLVANISKAIQ